MTPSVAARLLRWYDAGHRDLPWRRTDDPYPIWISEIMLQQTRAEAVIPYYRRFLERFPTLTALAGASPEDVLACWSGLGYYARARNLHQAARLIGSVFPPDYPTIRDLPGVGDYTAAAIASIAFGLPYAVLDGNVMRIVARLTNDPSDIGSASTRARFREIAQRWLDRGRAGAFNQAMMELGATLCLPREPRCDVCPLARLCEGRRAGRAAELPVKARKPAAVHIEMAVAIVERQGRILLWQRAVDEPRMAGFWELPSLSQCGAGQLPEAIGTFRHTITHHHYLVTVHVPGDHGKARVPKPLRWVPAASLPSLPLSTTAKKALRLVAQASACRGGLQFAVLAAIK